MVDWKEFVRRNLSTLGLPPEAELEMVEEISQHLQSIYDESLANGSSEQDACSRVSSLIKDWGVLECELARSKNPVLAAVKPLNTEITYSSQQSGHRGGLMLGSILQDLKYAVRMLRKNSVFTSVAVLSLALGIGANTAVFTLVDAVLLKMLPVKRPQELVLFSWVSGSNGMWRSISGNLNMNSKTGQSSSTAFPTITYTRFHESAQTLTDVFAYAQIEQLNVFADGRAEIASGQYVSGDYYKGLGVQAQSGRTITADDDRETANGVAVISHRCWQKRFGLEPAAIGKEVVINGSPFTIVGVTPRGFEGANNVGESADFSIPLSMEPRISHPQASMLRTPGNWWLIIMGRLKEGATEEQARAELETSFQQSAAEDRLTSKPEPGEEDSANPDIPSLIVTSGSRGLNAARTEYASSLTILLAVVGLVLLIACVNVANLLLARGTFRQKEIAVRLALGAKRSRLIRQLLTESVVLSLLGGALGLAFAYWGKDLLLTLRPWGGGPIEVDLNLDLRVLAFTTVVSLTTGILFGIMPALRATRIDLTPALKVDSRGVVGRSRQGLTKTLVVIQVALSLLLLIGAGLFVATLRNLQLVDVGFNANKLLIFRVSPILSGYKSEQIESLYQRLLERIQAVPGVVGVTLSRHPLLSGSSALDKVFVEGHPPPGPSEYTYVMRVGTNFFETMQIPLVKGRSFTAKDDGRTSKVVVINESMARKYFGDEDPLGKRLGLGAASHSNDVEVIGISRDAKYARIRGANPATLYFPYLQNQSSLGQMNFEVRTAGEPLGLATAVRDAVREVDPNLPLFEFKTQLQQREESLAQENLFATMSGFFGLIALLLACLGLYGVMSYAVARRTNEIGVRMALGAASRDVARMILRETMVLVIAGVCIGLAAAFATTRWLESMLFGLAPTDPIVISAAVLMMLATAGVAGYLPARRAASVDPMAALRYE